MNDDQLINKKVILTGVLLGFLLVLIGLTYLMLRGANRPASSATNPNIEITIIPASTSTPRLVSPSPHAMSPTPPATLTPIPGTIAVNTYVQISGTDGDGLRLRSSPSLSSEPLFLGFDSEVFLVVDGPAASDGFTWWYLTAPYDDTRSGWAVVDYLESIPFP